MAGEGDAERLVVLLEARIRDFEKNMAKASGTATRDFNRMRASSKSATAAMEADMMRSTARINQALAATSTRIGGYSRSMVASFTGVFAGAAVVRGTTALVDANTRVANSLKVAGLEGAALKSVYDALFVSAQKNAVPMEDMATLYGRATMAAKNLGASQQDLLKFADGVAVSLRVSGKSAQEASGALLQLSQLLGGSVVQAQEYNSLIDGAYPLLMAVAAGMKETGGDVAKLTELVKAGKVPTKAFFDAFQAGSSILQEKVAGAEITASQSLVRLQNVLQDAAGKFNSATGASTSFATTIDSVATSVDRLGSSQILAWLGKLNNLVESSGFLQLNTSLREIEAILKLVDSAVGGVADSFDGTANSTRDAISAALGFESVADAPTALRLKIDELTTSLTSGKMDADELRQELVKLEASPLNLGIQIGQIMELARAAIAAGGAVAAIDGGKVAAPGIALQRDEQRIQRTPTTLKPVSLDDYDAPTKKGKGKAEKKDTFAEALKQQQQRIDALNRETAAQGNLNPLIDDYGYSIEKLRVQIDLENEASRAGLALTPDRKAAIEQLAEGYARASAEAAKLEEKQNLARRSMEDWMGISKDLAQGFVSDLSEGKSATEALGNAFGNLAQQLLQMAADQAIKALFQNLFGAVLGGSGGMGVSTTGMGFFPGFNGLRLAEGGDVRGPGTGTSDSIPAMLSDGEFVVNASATKKNRGLLAWLNSGGDFLSRALGGPVLMPGADTGADYFGGEIL